MHGAVVYTSGFLNSIMKPCQWLDLKTVSAALRQFLQKLSCRPFQCLLQRFSGIEPYPYGTSLKRFFAALRQPLQRPPWRPSQSFSSVARINKITYRMSSMAYNHTPMVCPRNASLRRTALLLHSSSSSSLPKCGIAFAVVAPCIWCVLMGLGWKAGRGEWQHCPPTNGGRDPHEGVSPDRLEADRPDEQ